MQLKRFGVSLEEDLLEQLDGVVVEQSLPNRSQALRLLIKNYIDQQQWNEEDVAVGAIVLIHEHTDGDSQSRIATTQHEYHCLVLATQHIHLGNNLYLETLSVKGKARKLVKLANRLITLKGVINGKLVLSAIK